MKNFLGFLLIVCFCLVAQGAEKTCGDEFEGLKKPKSSKIDPTFGQQDPADLAERIAALEKFEDYEVLRSGDSRELRESAKEIVETEIARAADLWNLSKEDIRKRVDALRVRNTPPPPPPLKTVHSDPKKAPIADERFRVFKYSPEGWRPTFQAMPEFVTRGDFRKALGALPKGAKRKGAASDPVTHVSWKEAQEYIDALNKADSEFEYFLPTGQDLEYMLTANPPLRTKYREWTGDKIPPYVYERFLDSPNPPESGFGPVMTEKEWRAIRDPESRAMDAVARQGKRMVGTWYQHGPEFIRNYSSRGVDENTGEPDITFRLFRKPKP